MRMMPFQDELIDARTRLLPLTVDQYHQMIKAGIVEEGAPYELLDGHVVRKDRSAAGEDPMSVGNEHVLIVNRLGKLDAKLSRLGCFIQTQQPIVLPPADEPEPDASVVLGTAEDYAAALPTASDVTCVIEVADSSLRRDRTTKMRAYANAGIARYILINLPDRAVEVHDGPLVGKGRYARAVTLTSGQSFELLAAGKRTLKVAVRSVLP
jgi:Uma2 family endonuclease